MQTRKKVSIVLEVVVTIILLVLIVTQGSAQTASAGKSDAGPWTEETLDNESPWSSQGILSDLLYENEFTGDLQNMLGISDSQTTAIKKVAETVLLSYRGLDTESRPIVSDPKITLDEKRKMIIDMGYNRRVVKIVNDADRATRGILTAEQYPRFLDWAKKKYQEATNIAEQHKHRPAPDARNFPNKDLPGQK